MKIFIKVSLLFFLFSTIIINAKDFGGSDILLEPLNEKLLEFMPVTADFRNYFVLQSFEDHTNILIGDFVGAEKKIILISDNDNDNKVDDIREYYPDTKKKKNPLKPNSDLYSDFLTMKKEIISGKIYKENYSYRMRSLPILLEKMKLGSDIYKHDRGYTVKLYDPDNSNTIMAEFFFQRKDGAYDLIFKTNYYKLYHTVVRPPLVYSVYCIQSNDPIVKETVEKLIAIIEQ